MADDRALKALRVSESRYRRLFETARDGILLLNADTAQIEDVNPYLIEMLGYSHAEFLGKKLWEVGAFVDIAQSKEMFAELQTKGYVRYDDLPLKTKAGTAVPVEFVSNTYDCEGVKVIQCNIRNISERKRAAQTLNESEERFREMAQSIRDTFFLRDAASHHMLYVSPGYEETWGRSCESLYANPQSWSGSMHPDDRALTDEKSNTGMFTGKFDIEFRIVRPDGMVRWIQTRGAPICDHTGKVVRIAGVATDITERKEAQRRIVYLNRVYAVLSGINALIVRVRDRDDLFKEACRIAVEAGGFRMAMIAMVDRGTLQLVPIASVGKDEALLSAVKEILSSPEESQKTMGARAIREKKAIVSNDSQNDPQVVFGAEYIQAGIHSMAVFPLIVSDESVGVLVLYASEIAFFREEEMKLLTELSGDVAFAMDYIEKQDRLDYLAYYDVLTGLANRSLFLERVAQYLRSAASGEHQLALFIIDLDRFRNINDSLGRLAGDELLRQVAQWLTHKTGDPALLARVGSDQFAMVLPHVTPADGVAQLLEQTMNAFVEQPFHLNGAVFRVAARVGGTLFPQDGADAETLLRNAEAALKKAKTNGERWLFFTHHMTATVAAQLTLENQLRQALDRGELVLHYQPKVNLVSGKMTSAEALLRWNDPRTGLVPPGQFIPLLEETGLIYEVGRWALQQAIADYLRWRAAGLPAVRIAVNVSALQLRHHGFIAEIEQAIGVDAQAAAGLELEITESLIMADISGSIATLHAIRAMGVSIAIDDFGTGFSSLSYLAKLPVDTLKIDRSFVINMTTGPQGLALVSTIINLAHALQLKVVAEGVETEEQSHLLGLLSCDEIQGYLFSKPVPSDIFEARFLAPPPAG